MMFESRVETASPLLSVSCLDCSSITLVSGGTLSSLWQDRTDKTQMINAAAEHILPSSMLFANKDVSAQLIKMLANNVVNKEVQLLDLAYSSVRKRVANAIVFLYEQQQKEQQQISILRDDLARLVGTAKESVIRMLTEFKADGLINIHSGGVIEVKDLLKLKSLNA